MISFDKDKDFPEFSFSLQDEICSCLNYFSKKELAFAKKLSEKRKTEWILGRIAAKRAVKNLIVKRSGIVLDFFEIEIMSRKFQKPVLEIKNLQKRNDLFQDEIFSKIDLSISHNQDMAVAATTFIDEGGSIGIDLESRRIFSEDFLKDFLTKKEFSNLNRIDPNDKNLIATVSWCAKEAFLKAKGTGLCQHPKKLEISFEISKKRGIIKEVLNDLQASFFWKELPENFVVVICKIQAV